MNVRSFATALVAAASALSLFACPKPAVTPPPPRIEKPAPPPIRVPEGCEAPLGGDYAHGLNSSYLYRGEDDGGTLLLSVQRPETDGGSSEEDGGSFVSVNRTPNGFTGITSAVVFTQRGTQCRVEFPTDVVSCFDGGLLLRAASSASVDESCAVPTMAAPSPRIEHRLLRVQTAPVVEDAGESVSDAGKTTADGG